MYIGQHIDFKKNVQYNYTVKNTTISCVPIITLSIDGRPETKQPVGRTSIDARDLNEELTE